MSGGEVLNMANEFVTSEFEQNYRCYPVSFLDKPHLENGDKIIMPPSALDRLASLHIEYPMLFQIRNPSVDRFTHCGVLEFIADEGLVYMPYWIMENMLLQEGDIVRVRNISLAKGTYVKLQPHTTDFLDISNPKAVLETSLRNYSCLTTGDTIIIPYNNKKYYINIVDAKPSSAVSIIETDCEVDFAPPLDYKEPEKPAPRAQTIVTAPEDEDEPAAKKPKLDPFSGSGRRLDGKPSTQPNSSTTEPILRQHQPVSKKVEDSSKPSSAARKVCGKLVFGATAKEPQGQSSKAASEKNGEKESIKKPEEEAKFQAFTGKKYSLKD